MYYKTQQIRWAVYERLIWKGNKLSKNISNGSM